MTIKKNVKKTVLLNLYSQEVDDLKCALQKIIEGSEKVYVESNAYTNLFKNSNNSEKDEDAFFFLARTQGPSCITMDNYDREIILYINEENIEGYKSYLEEMRNSLNTVVKGLEVVYIAKKQYALVAFWKKRSKKDETLNYMELIKSEAGRLLEGGDIC